MSRFCTLSGLLFLTCAALAQFAPGSHGTMPKGAFTESYPLVLAESVIAGGRADKGDSRSTATGCLAKSASGQSFVLKSTEHPNGLRVDGVSPPPNSSPRPSQNLARQGALQPYVGHIVTLAGLSGRAFYNDPRSSQPGTLDVGANGQITVKNMIMVRTFLANDVINVGETCRAAPENKNGADKTKGR